MLALAVEFEVDVEVDADAASAAFLRAAVSNAEEECTEGRLRTTAVAVVGATAEEWARAADGSFFAGLFWSCAGAAFKVE